MSRNDEWEYLRAIYYRYRKASQALRRQILDEFCATCGYHRKYASGCSMARHPGSLARRGGAGARPTALR